MLRSIDKWLPGYVRSVFRRSGCGRGTKHLLFCIADHFEPFRRGAGVEGEARNVTAEDARSLVKAWVCRYPEAASAFRDSDGRLCRHTFFYPQEENDPGCLDHLSTLCAEGYGEVEVHLHHRNDTAEGLREKLVSFRNVLRDRHGLLGNDREGNVRYAFIHGNWSLCNSLPDGDWCGVNEELGILRDTGCYADFTFPSAPSPTQPRMVNCIYRAVDTPGRPRGCDRGQLVMCRGAEGGEKRAEGGNLKPERAAEGGNLKPERAAEGGNLKPERAAEGGNLKPERVAEGGDLKPERTAEGGNLKPERVAEGGDLKPERAAEGGNLKPERAAEGGNLKTELPKTGDDRRLALSDSETQASSSSCNSGFSPPPSSLSQTQVSGFRPHPSLVLITGPLGLNWRNRKWGILPRLENADVSAANPPSAERVRTWVRQDIHVAGRPEWVFVKIHTHGCVEANREIMLGAAMSRVRQYIHSRFNDGKAWQLHYVSAREMYNIVRAAEDGMTGNPGEYRDYEIAPPPRLSRGCGL